MLERLGVEFVVPVSGAEVIVHGVTAEVVLANALIKARVVAASGSIVIGCDTDVVIEDKLIGKPEDEIRALEYLAQLSGRTHRVLSGLAVLGPAADQVRTGVVESRVTFRRLGSQEIDRYLASED